MGNDIKGSKESPLSLKLIMLIGGVVLKVARKNTTHNFIVGDLNKIPFVFYQEIIIIH